MNRKKGGKRKWVERDKQLDNIKEEEHIKKWKHRHILKDYENIEFKFNF
jgi:hypothetical protein